MPRTAAHAADMLFALAVLAVRDPEACADPLKPAVAGEAALPGSGRDPRRRRLKLAVTMISLRTGDTSSSGLRSTTSPHPLPRGVALRPAGAGPDSAARWRGCRLTTRRHQEETTREPLLVSSGNHSGLDAGVGYGMHGAAA